jgi:hypothetical protein
VIEILYYAVRPALYDIVSTYAPLFVSNTNVQLRLRVWLTYSVRKNLDLALKIFEAQMRNRHDRIDQLPPLLPGDAYVNRSSVAGRREDLTPHPGARSGIEQHSSLGFT